MSHYSSVDGVVVALFAATDRQTFVAACNKEVNVYSALYSLLV